MNTTPSAQRMSFAHPGSVPPIGYMYEETLEGEVFSFQASTKTDMVRVIREWYTAKQLEWPGDKEMSARVEHFICERIPDGFCKGKGGKKGFLFSTPRIRDATRLFMKRLMHRKGMLVPPEEADRRAKICANCPANMHGICTSCAGNEFQDIFRWFIQQGRTTPYDRVLDTCTVCGCLLKAKVHVDIEHLAQLQPHTYPENCWLFNTPCHVPAKTDSGEPT